MKQIKITERLTVRDARSLELYFQDVNAIPVLEADEEVEIAIRSAAGDEAATERLIVSNLRFVISVAKQYQNGYMTLGELINEGNIGLIKAARKFDHTRGFKFISYAVWWIRQSVMASLHARRNIYNIPSNQAQTINRTRRESSELEQKLEREPTDEELAEYSNELFSKTDACRTGTSNRGYMDEKSVRQAKALAIKPKSLSAPITNAEDGTIGDLLADRMFPLQQEIMERKESLPYDVKRVMKRLLKPREHEITVYYFGLEGTAALSLGQIGDALDLTRERVRQILDKSIKKLQARPEVGELLRQYLDG